MRINEVVFTDALPIDGYGPGFWRIGGKVIRNAVALGPNGLSDWGGYEDVDVLLAIGAKVDVLFIGTGAETAYLPKPLKEALQSAGVAAEPMASAAAARTYNVLLSEGRRIGAALLTV
ncbi:MAG: Mth938-like domain-containing protein [Rhodobacteraceae bacterium]|nr:Mth938-like domain-containing protein [Paracoccaceae bacterium]